MLHIKKILLPTDGSEYAFEALRYTSSFAKEYNIIVYLLTVVEVNRSIYDVYADEINFDLQESKIISIVNKRLDATEKKAREMGIQNITKISRLGHPYEEIINVSKENAIDLIVMATHGRSGLSHFLIGSITEKVIRMAPCPVLVVRPKIHGLIENNNNEKKKG